MKAMKPEDFDPTTRAYPFKDSGDSNSVRSLSNFTLGLIVMHAYRWMPWFDVKQLDTWRWHWGWLPGLVTIFIFQLWSSRR